MLNGNTNRFIELYDKVEIDALVKDLDIERDSLRLTLIETQNELQAHNAIMTENGIRAEKAEAEVKFEKERSEGWRLAREAQFNRAEKAAAERDAALARVGEVTSVALLLLAVAAKAYFLADGTCEHEGVFTVEEDDFIALSEALDPLDDLPEPGPNIIGTGPAKAAAILKRSTTGAGLTGGK